MGSSTLFSGSLSHLITRRKIMSIPERITCIDGGVLRVLNLRPDLFPVPPLSNTACVSSFKAAHREQGGSVKEAYRPRVPPYARGRPIPWASSTPSVSPCPVPPPLPTPAASAPSCLSPSPRLPRRFRFDSVPA